MFSFKGVESKSSVLLIKDNSLYSKCHKEVELIRLKLFYQYSTMIPSSSRGLGGNISGFIPTEQMTKISKVSHLTSLLRALGTENFPVKCYLSRDLGLEQSH